MDRCDPAEILAVLDEVEAQLLVVDIDLFPVEGGNAEQMNLYITVRARTAGLEEIVDILQSRKGKESVCHLPAP